MSEPTEDIIKREIAAARQIIREDRVLSKLNKVYPDEPEEGGDDGNPKPPKKKGDAPDNPPAKRGGLWWGDAVSGE